MNRVLLIPTLILVVLGLSCFFAGGADIASDGAAKPIVFCNADEVHTLDPGQMSWANDIRVAMALWEGLTAYDLHTLEPVPGMAESWTISPDGKTYAFHLRKNARWSNGDPVTAADFLFAWRRVLTPVTASDYIGLFRGMVGAEEYTKAVDEKKPGGADFSKVGVKAPDPYTLVVTLKAPCGYFLDLCAFPPFFPQHQEAMRKFLLDPNDENKGYDERWTRPGNLVCNGPYVLKDWKFKQYMELVPNPQYWDREHVRCPQLIIKGISDPRAALLAYQDGQIDVLSSIPPEFGDDLIAQRDKGLRKDIHYRPVFGTYYFIFNCTRKPLDDPRVRKALSLAIDKEKIVRDVTHMNQKPLGVLVPPDSIPGYVSPEPLAMNVKEASRLLAEAGYPDGKGLPAIEVLYNSEVAVHGMIAQAIGQMWSQNLGVHVTYSALERASFGAARQAHSFDVARAGWYGDYVDPTTWLDLLRTGDGNNDGLYSNPAYDKLLAQAAAEADPAKRLGILHDAEALLVHDEFPIIPLYQYGDGLIFDDGKIGGLEANVRLLTPLKWIYRK